MIDLDLEKLENNHNFLCFCSLLCLLNGKKLNIPNIFLLVLKNDVYRSLLKYMLTIDNDYDLLKFFLEYDPKISKSKHITKFLNSTKGFALKKSLYGFSRENLQRVSRRVKKSEKPAIQRKKKLSKSE